MSVELAQEQHPEALALLDIDIYVAEAARLMPGREAISDSARTISWSELDRRANRIAHALIACNVGPDDKVAILAPNSVWYVEIMIGILRAGACIVPLPTYASPSTWISMLKDCDAQVLFVSQGYADEIDGLADKALPPTVVALDEPSIEAWIAASVDIGAGAGGGNAHDTSPALPHVLDHGFNLIYSSGTTGTPKGILQSRRYRAIESVTVVKGWGLNDESRTIFSTPLCSNTTLFVLFSVLAAGGRVKLMEKFDAGKWLALAHTWRPTDVILVPVQYTRLLAHPDFDRFDLSSFRNKFSTSAPLSGATKREILDRWPAGGLTEFYGMTEGGVSCSLIAQDHPDKLDTVGKPFADVEIRILDEQGSVLPQGAVGEVVGRSPRMMTGYHKQDEATREASWFDDSGRRFQRSGDIGWLDPEGFLHLLDRKKDVIITGGFNVYAIDIEHVLMQHPSVTDAAVIGAPSKAWGETPVAFVVLRDGVEVSPEEIGQWANDRLGKVQRLARVIVTNELPRSAIGKVLKRALRDQCLELALSL